MSKDQAKHGGQERVDEQQVESSTSKPQCGIVMPISDLDGCPAAHWADVKSILIDALEDVGFTGHLVSEAEDVGTIHKRIIQHLHDDPVIICDVSGKNANVMFELGLRLAFDKPTIIVKDDKTGYSFDTSPIEHLTYPRDLRFARIVDFKRDLGKKVLATFEAGKKADFSTFLKHFGTFTVAKLDTKEVSQERFMLEQISEMRAELRVLAARLPSDRGRTHSLSKLPANPLLLQERVRLAIQRLTIRGVVRSPMSPKEQQILVDRVARELPDGAEHLSDDEFASEVEVAMKNCAAFMLLRDPRSKSD